jgi:hypothetical protein
MPLRGHMAVYCKDGIPVQFVWPARGQPVTRSFTSETGKKDRENICLYSATRVNGFLATKHPKKHQNGHLPITTYKRLVLTKEVHEALV